MFFFCQSLDRRASEKDFTCWVAGGNLSVHRWFKKDAPPHAKAYRRWSRTRPPQEMRFGNPFQYQLFLICINDIQWEL